MLTPTAEQIRTLAPDASAARAGESLGDARRWSAGGRSETAAWGLCQGSGSSPYQTAVDLAGPAYKCSCPSRKIPCKHALGLLFLLAEGQVEPGQPPDWAADWLSTRVARAEAAASRSEAITAPDPTARARRAESRERKVAAGIEELERWLADLLRRGLDGARGEGYAYWDSMGARLVDAQAAGLGRSVRGLGALAHAGPAWPHLLLEGSARLHLLTEAYRRADSLPAPLRADVRSLVGWTTKEDELDEAAGVDDRWLVVGRRVDESGQVITARTFLLGEGSGRFALHLAFGVDAAPPTPLATPGQAFRARLLFYPSATPLRAAVRPMIVPDGEVTALSGGAGVAEVLRGHADRLALNPFVGAWPVLLRGVVPLLRADELLLRDADGSALPVQPPSLGPRLLAISGGRAMTVGGEWDGSYLRPFSAFAEGRLVPIEAADITLAPPASGDAAWSQLLSLALLGTERAGDGASRAGAVLSSWGLTEPVDRERGLLAAAGVVALRRRAGRQPIRSAEPLPDTAEADEHPALAGAPARLLGLVVGEQRALLPEVLALLRASGRRLPDEWLPELLALAATDGALRADIARLGGRRAAWLTGMVPELAGGVPRPGDWEEAWQRARSGRERAAVLRSLRRSDGVAAREALAARLSDVAGDERALLIEALAYGLGPDDEPLLSGFLADRRLDVRRAAAGLLATLEGSALAQVLQARARPLLSITGRVRQAISADLPEPDAELDSAGFGGKPPAGLGERAWLLRQLLGHVPPARWQEWLGLPPAALVERALRSAEARPVLEGWLEAAQRFADPSWTTALLVEPKVAEAIRLTPVAALAALPPESRPAIVVRIAGVVAPDMLTGLAGQCPRPWPETLGREVLAVLERLNGEVYPEQAYYELARAAALGLPPAQDDELYAVATHAGLLRPALSGAIETIRLRSRIHAAFGELQPSKA